MGTLQPQPQTVDSAHYSLKQQSLILERLSCLETKQHHRRGHETSNWPEIGIRVANKKVNKQQNATDTTRDMGTRLGPLISWVAGKKELQVTNVNFSEALRISRTHCTPVDVWEASGRRPGGGGSWPSNCFYCSSEYDFYCVCLVCLLPIYLPPPPKNRESWRELRESFLNV